MTLETGPLPKVDKKEKLPVVSPEGKVKFTYPRGLKQRHQFRIEKYKNGMISSASLSVRTEEAYLSIEQRTDHAKPMEVGEVYNLKEHVGMNPLPQRYVVSARIYDDLSDTYYPSEALLVPNEIGEIISPNEFQKLVEAEIAKERDEIVLLPLNPFNNPYDGVDKSPEDEDEEKYNASKIVSTRLGYLYTKNEKGEFVLNFLTEKQLEEVAKTPFEIQEIFEDLQSPTLEIDKSPASINTPQNNPLLSVGEISQPLYEGINPINLRAGKNIDVVIPFGLLNLPDQMYDQEALEVGMVAKDSSNNCYLVTKQPYIVVKKDPQGEIIKEFFSGEITKVNPGKKFKSYYAWQTIDEQDRNLLDYEYLLDENERIYMNLKPSTGLSGEKVYAPANGGPNNSGPKEASVALPVPNNRSRVTH